MNFQASGPPHPIGTDGQVLARRLGPANWAQLEAAFAAAPVRDLPCRLFSQPFCQKRAHRVGYPLGIYYAHY
jgi:hypothetical protein